MSVTVNAAAGGVRGGRDQSLMLVSTMVPLMRIQACWMGVGSWHIPGWHMGVGSWHILGCMQEGGGVRASWIYSGRVRGLDVPGM
jgi:hypothetical protein